MKNVAHVPSGLGVPSQNSGARRGLCWVFLPTVRFHHGIYYAACYSQMVNHVGLLQGHVQPVSLCMQELGMAWGLLRPWDPMASMNGSG